jgi:ATP-binding cassette subfamily B protein
MQDSIISTLFYTMVGVIASVGSALVYWFGGMMAISGTISIGTIVAYVAYLGMIYGPLSALVNARIAFIKAMVSFERVFEVLDLPIEIAESENPIEPVEIRGDVRFENVSFTYSVLPGQVVVKLEEQKRYAQQWSTGDWRSGMGKTYEELKDGEIRWVLRDVSVEIKAGQMVALVGRSGAGKTTMTYLVPRLYDVNEGRVTIDGIDVRDLKLSWLQRHIGMVTQDVYLFHDTVRANLLYARPLASDDDIERACRVANIWDFIQSLPEGLDTLVGERGFKLSGGEKQRIAIARAVLKDPKILILDEATSNLDSESEILIQQALEHLFKGRTSIVIAHRLSTILKADVIVVLDKGQVVEIGTHHELLAKNGLYSMLYHTQFKQNKQVPSSKDNKNQYDSEIHKSVNIL